MKTIKTYTILLALLSFAACSKKSSSNDTNNAKFPDNIAGTWSRTAIGSSADTGIDNNSGQKWVMDIVILANSEAAKLQTLIQSAPKQTKDDFADKCKKYVDKANSPEFAVRSDLAIRSTEEYKNFYNFCVNNKQNVLLLAMGYLFNDADELSSGLGATALSFTTENVYEDLKKEVANEKEARQYTEDGKYIISYTPVSLQRRLAKKILNQL